MKRLPLEGIRVADLTQVWAGPYATRVLAEMGAEVIKVESLRSWDMTRTLVMDRNVKEDPWNASYFFNDYNRDKKSLTLDLQTPRGRELFLQLAAVSDVVIENYRADVLDKLELGYEVLRQAKPDVILVSMAGFGKTGADRDLSGYGPVVEAMSGLTSLTGYGDDGIPYRVGISYGDPIAGLAAAGAVALALVHRRRTGEGACIDLSQREVMASLIGEAFVAASQRGETPRHRGNRDPRFVPQGVYPVAGEDEWVAVSVREEAQWRALAALIGAVELAKLDAESRWHRHDEIDARIAAWTAPRPGQEVQDELSRAGVPAGRVLNTGTVHDDPHLEARGFWTRLPHPRMHSWRQPITNWRFVEAQPMPRRHAPLLGEHNREVLVDLLGVDEAELAVLEAEGVIGTRLPGF